MPHPVTEVFTIVVLACLQGSLCWRRWPTLSSGSVSVGAALCPDYSWRVPSFFMSWLCPMASIHWSRCPPSFLFSEVFPSYVNLCTVTHGHFLPEPPFTSVKCSCLFCPTISHHACKLLSIVPPPPHTPSQTWGNSVLFTRLEKIQGLTSHHIQYYYNCSLLSLVVFFWVKFFSLW